MMASTADLTTSSADPLSPGVFLSRPSGLARPRSVTADIFSGAG
jgi:hypothetical protein